MRGSRPGRVAKEGPRQESREKRHSESMLAGRTATAAVAGCTVFSVDSTKEQ